MISNQEMLVLSPYMAIYDLVVPQDNQLRKINEFVDFTFIYEELKKKYCLDKVGTPFLLVLLNNSVDINSFIKKKDP